MSAREQLVFLNSSKRRRVIELLTTGSAPPGELAEQAAISRPTVHRALAQSADWGWVTTNREKPTDETHSEKRSETPHYALSSAGQLIVEAWPQLGGQIPTDRDRGQGQDPSFDSDESLDPSTIEYLIGSAERGQLLIALREQPQTGSDLVADSHLSIGQSMISQTLSTLFDYGWIKQPNEGKSYVLTPTGERVLDRYACLKETVDWVTTNACEINCLGEIGATLPVYSIVQHRAQVEMINAAPGNPDAILNHYADRLVECEPDYIQGITPAVSSFANQIHKPLIEEGVAVEVIIDEQAYKAAQSAYPEMLREAVTCELFDLSVYPDQLAFGMAIFDSTQRAIISGHGEVGVGKTCIDGSIESFVEWALMTFEDYQAAATPIEKIENVNEQGNNDGWPNGER